METQVKQATYTSAEIFQIKDGWEPFLLEDISPTSVPAVYRLLGLYQGQRREIFTLHGGLQTRAPYFIRALDDGGFQVSTYWLTSAESGELQFVARLFLSDFVALMPIQSEPMNSGQAKRLRRADKPSLTKPRLTKNQGNGKKSNDPSAKKFLDDAKRLAKDGPQPVKSMKENKKMAKSATVTLQKTISRGPTVMQLAFENANKDKK